MIYFTADLHFGHSKIINHCSRPFQNAEEMDKTLIKNWNNTVSCDDETYILGDFTMRGGMFANEILRLLNGKKYFIKGNHDRFCFNEAFDNNLVEWTKDYYMLEYETFQFVLFHYPIEHWWRIKSGAIHLHGHSHNGLEYNLSAIEKGNKRFDVGVDANNYRPISVDEVISWVV